MEAQKLTSSRSVSSKNAGRSVRRLGLSVLILLIVASATARVRTYLLVRKINLVLTGLALIKADQTTDADLVRTVPYLERHEENGLGQRFYWVVVSNESDWLMKHIEFEQSPEWLVRAWGWFGVRYVYFEGGAIVVNGTVSSIRYGISTQMVFPREAGYLVSARSFHSFWKPRKMSFGVASEKDESPQYGVSGDEKVLSAWFTSDAPSDLTAHVFQLNLGCFWSLGGCSKASQIAPALLQDNAAISTAVIPRLRSIDPCPDRVLAARIRYLLDVDVVLAEVTKFRIEKVANETGDDAQEYFTDYQLVDVIRGQSRRVLKDLRYNPVIPSPTNPSERIANPISPLHKVGEKVLLFSNNYFYSCAVVPATPSALAAVRTAVPAPKRPEDEVESPM